MKSKPNPIDRAVGAKVRAFRLLAGLSQEKLGAILGVSFQQVQKYESGANRIGASRLQQISVALQAPLTSFFDDAMIPEATASLRAEELNTCAAEFLSTADGQRFLMAIRQVRDAKTRKTIVDLVVALAESDNSDTEKHMRPAA